MTDFLQLQDKTILLFGVANRRSVAYHVSRVLEQAGAKVLYVVRSQERKESVAKLLAALVTDKLLEVHDWHVQPVGSAANDLRYFADGPQRADVLIDGPHHCDLRFFEPL